MQLIINLDWRNATQVSLFSQLNKSFISKMIYHHKDLSLFTIKLNVAKFHINLTKFCDLELISKKISG